MWPTRFGLTTIPQYTRNPTNGRSMGPNPPMQVAFRRRGRLAHFLPMFALLSCPPAVRPFFRLTVLMVVSECDYCATERPAIFAYTSVRLATSAATTGR
mmetsp:Transcript_28225/g.86242  ORF Transcript_28225/g.86242 Transcript_28225/m.86242 type:complete len:99 (-) Transcript_28225:74-370(-)|eukprot:scaffold176610_cov27-Tisochrysis_lutea.AAC.4